MHNNDNGVKSKRVGLLKEKDELYAELSVLNDKISGFYYEISRLRDYVETYRTTIVVSTREKLRSKYVDSINSLNLIDLKVPPSRLIPNIKLADTIDIDVCFKTLRIRADAVKSSLKEKLKDEFRREISAYIRGNIKIHVLSKVLKDLMVYETTFKEDIFVASVFYEFYKGFSYHFLTDNEINRLDKPEWAFQYMLENLSTYLRVINVYTNLYKGPNWRNLFFNRIEQLVTMKFDELKTSTSSQKRDLIIHAADSFFTFQYNVFKSYRYKLVPINIVSYVIDVEREYIENIIERTSSLDGQLWFDEYRKLLKNIFAASKIVSSMDPGFIATVYTIFVDRLLSKIDLFLSKCSFNSRSDTVFLMFIFRNLTDLKLFVAELEAESIFNGVRLDLSVSLCNVDSTKLGKHALGYIPKINILITNEILHLLRFASNFKYIPEAKLSKILVELKDFFSTARHYLHETFDRLLGGIKDTVDGILYDRIVLTTRLNSDELLIFRTFFLSIKEVVGIDDEWQCDIALAIITNIQEDEANICINSLSEKLKELYKHS